MNNIHAKSFGAPEFQEKGAVTLSTIYKAKGNEAYCVYIVGIDGLFWRPSHKDRNRAFTAMTRTKGWLCITGVGASAQRFGAELQKAKDNFPSLQFVQPSEQDFVFMKRDLVMADPSAVDATSPHPE
ncbi:ATP-binding domain-containing protein [Xanthomonas oryzae]|uniref:ATP-binding domain-containing protein n=1 Tax=Xanthomonas oryzae pv. leersiae TaxID=3112258 RepID=A0AAJ6GST2_9XANT|nr:ATP-binding domain-containing protein [Xanthomonas oryzae]WIX07148.1 ATP-binding domain-containing protein [Xanthomonas oryzae pv. oryzae]